MAIQDIEIFGRMLGEMAQEAPQNYSISPEDAAAYGSSEKFVLGMQKAVAENRYGRFIAEDNGEVVGAVTSMPKNGLLRIGNMYVRPYARSLGIGSRLLAACEVRAVRDGYPTASLEVGSQNHTARLFYKNHGYVSQNPPEIHEWGVSSLFGEVLIKDLQTTQL